MKHRPGLNDMLNSPQANGLLRDKQAVESLMRSGEAQQLMKLLDQSSGGGLKDAAQSAMQGDAAQLMGLVEGLMKNPQTVKLMEELQKKVGK